MKNNPLVSIVTPCYNGEKKTPLFLESVLNQTYDNIEIIFVNDGSKDNTEEICREYKEKFEAKGYRFIYIKQENKGQAEALNNGLQYVQGKYLTWPDSDDVLLSNYVSAKVDYLESHSDKNMVISPIRHVKQNGKIVCIETRKQTEEDNLFLDMLKGTNFYYPPGGYMITTESFLSAYPNRRIPVSPVGQNIQMLLPIAYTHKYGYIDDVLYDYMIYEDSHAHVSRTFEESVKKNDLTCDLYLMVMHQMNISDVEYEKYSKLLEHERYRKHFYFGIQYKNRMYMNSEYKKYRLTGIVPMKDKVLHIVRNIVW